MRPFCHFLVHLEWLFKMLSHFVHSYALTIAWTSTTQVQREGYLLVQHQVHLLVHLYVYKYWSSLLGAAPGVLSGAPRIASSGALQMHSSFFRLHSHLYSQFLIDQILHPFAPLSLFSSILKSILKCVPYTLSFAIPVTSFPGAIVTFLCSSKYVVDYNLKNVYTKACAIYSAGTALYACIK